jgi:hypothetical protein
MEIKLIVEASSDSFCVYSSNIEGIYGHGDTVQKAKDSALQGLNNIRQYAPHQLPKWALDKDVSVKYTFDIKSLLCYYKGIFTLAGIERMTGINQRQLHHYMTGLKKPRITQYNKIINAIKAFGNELQAIE